MWVAVGGVQGHYNDVTWTPWRLKSPAGRLVVYVIVEAEEQRKHRSSPLLAFYVGTPPVTHGFLSQKGQ